MTLNDQLETSFRRQRTFVLAIFFAILLATIFSSLWRPVNSQQELSRCNSPQRFDDISYRIDSNDSRHTLDITVPEAFDPAKEPALPVFFFVHGGGWVTFDKKGPDGKYADFVEKLTQRGFIGVSINYRLAPDHQHPAQVEDVTAALAWTLENIGDYGGDPDRLILAGHSAGGHLVSLATLHRESLEKAGIPGFEPLAVVSIGGVFDVNTDELFQALEEVTYYIESAFTLEATTRKQASPIYHLDVEEPLSTRFILAYGDDDLPTLDSQAKAFHDALQSRGFQSEVLLLPNRDHYTEIVMTGWEDDLILPTIQRLISPKKTPPNEHSSRE